MGDRSPLERLWPDLTPAIGGGEVPEWGRKMVADIEQELPSASLTGPGRGEGPGEKPFLVDCFNSPLLPQPIPPPPAPNGS